MIPDKLQVVFAVIILFAVEPSHAAPLRLSLEVDSRDNTHGIQHAHLTIPVHAGPLTLAYPKWIPGEHRPSGPITQLMNLHMRAGDRPLLWRRDSLDAFSYHVSVPPNASVLDVQFDYFSPPKSFGSGFGETPNTLFPLIPELVKVLRRLQQEIPRLTRLDRVNTVLLKNNANAKKCTR